MKSINKTPLQSYLLTKNPSLLPPEVPNFSFPLTISSPTYVFQEFSAEDEVLVNDELIVLDTPPPTLQEIEDFLPVYEERKRVKEVKERFPLPQKN